MLAIRLGPGLLTFRGAVDRISI